MKEQITVNPGDDRELEEVIEQKAKKIRRPQPNTEQIRTTTKRIIDIK